MADVHGCNPYVPVQWPARARHEEFFLCVLSGPYLYIVFNSRSFVKALGNTGGFNVTVQAGLRIHCKDRGKIWWQQASAHCHSWIELVYRYTGSCTLNVD